MKTILTITLLLALMETGFAQQDSLADVFPLAIGNRWSYGFYTRDAGTMTHFSTEDTGFVEYQVIGSIYSSDSISWQFIQRRDFMRTVYPSFTPYLVQDSSNFEIVELTQGRHELYTPVYDPLRCFPFQKSYADSSRFFRYIQLDSVGRAYVHLFFEDPTNPGLVFAYKSYFTATKNSGIIQASGGQWNFAISKQMRYNRHPFVPTITAVHHSEQERPESFMLSQNYPNPFNPTTRISFSIPHTSFVRLEVFDLLGKKVASLVNEKLKFGYYERTFDAKGLSSGMYFYRLQANNSNQTRKLILLK